MGCYHLRTVMNTRTLFNGRRKIRSGTNSFAGIAKQYLNQCKQTVWHEESATLSKKWHKSSVFFYFFDCFKEICKMMLAQEDQQERTMNKMSQEEKLVVDSLYVACEARWSFFHSRKYFFIQYAEQLTQPCDSKRKNKYAIPTKLTMLLQHVILDSWSHWRIWRYSSLSIHAMPTSEHIQSQRPYTINTE